MKTSNISNTSKNSKTKKAGPMVNAVIASVLLLSALPVAVIGFLQIFPPISDASSKVETIKDTKPKISAAERRAQRREAREAKKALAKNTPNQGESVMQHHLRTVQNITVSEEGYEALDFYSGFGPGFGPGFHHFSEYVISRFKGQSAHGLQQLADGAHVQRHQRVRAPRRFLRQPSSR